MEYNYNAATFILASVLTSYPDSQYCESISTLLDDENIQIDSKLKSELNLIIRNPSLVDDLRSDYIAIFDHSKSENPIYETEYGRDRAMFKANELSDIAGFYKAFGFEMDQESGTREMVDHVSVELEFYSLLKMKYQHLLDLKDQVGCEIVYDGTKKFLNDHLGRFVSSIAARPGVVTHPYYNQVFHWIAEQIKQDCKLYGVDPEQVSWLGSQVESESMCCGGTVGINK